MPMQYQGDPINTFMKGIGTGSDMFSKLMNAKYNNSLHPSGDVANAMYVEQLRNQYGDNDPRYLAAKQAHELQLAARQSLMDYRGQLSDTAAYRATSPLGRSIAEGEGRGALDVLGGGKRYNALGQKVTGQPNQEGAPYDDEKARAYEMDIAKKTTDSDARKKYNYAVNIDKTRTRINPDHLLAYSGLKGTGRLLRDQALAQTGKVPQSLLDYQKSLSAANLLAKQVRQFYGESIQPAMAEKLEHLTNPSNWYKNPQLAKAEYDAINDILDAETETYKQAGTSPITLRKKTPQQTKITQPDSIVDGDSASEDDTLLALYADDLIKENPKWTPENIKHTAKIHKKSIGAVVDELMNIRK